MKWRFLNIAVLILNVLVSGATIYLLSMRVTPSGKDVGRYEYIDLSLSILNMMVAILAILLATAAFWGYAAIREAATAKAGEVADRVARQVAQEYAERDGEAGDMRQIANFIRWQREQNENKTEPAPGRKRPVRPSGGEREGDGI